MAAAGQRVRLRVLVGNERGLADAAPGLSRWLADIAPAAARGTVNVSLVSETRIRELNRRFRGRNQATDVLSFPSFNGGRDGFRARGRSCLGDIVIARGVARRQARAAGHSERMELRVLALHGLLHLLGYDHESDDGQMSRVEAHLRRKGGLPKGLIERERTK
jgi:probable rRNA maturation factor